VIHALQIFYDLFELTVDPVDQNRYVLVVIDHFSKFTWARAFPAKDARPIAEFLEHIFQVEGTPARTVSDNGREFVNTIMQQLHEKYGIGISHGLPYHPENQGVVERKNRSLKSKVHLTILLKRAANSSIIQIMITMNSKRTYEWSSGHILDDIVEAQNNTRHKTTGQVPFVVLRLHYNRPYLKRFAEQHNLLFDEANTPHLVRNPVELHSKVHERMKKKAEQMQLRSIQDCPEYVPFEVGTRVYVARRGHRFRAWQPAARILKTQGKQRYVIQWITQGNTKRDVIGSIAVYRHQYVTGSNTLANEPAESCHPLKTQFPTSALYFSTRHPFQCLCNQPQLLLLLMMKTTRMRNHCFRSSQYLLGGAHPTPMRSRCW